MVDRLDILMRCNKLEISQRAECYKMVDCCSSRPSGPYFIGTTDSEVQSADQEMCFALALSIASRDVKVLTCNGISVPGSESYGPQSGGGSEFSSSTYEPPPIAVRYVPPLSSIFPAAPSASSGADIDRSGFCTEQTGFIPEDRARISWEHGVATLYADGLLPKEGLRRVPMLINGSGNSGRGRFILLPSRDVHFMLDKAVPVRRSEFRDTIGSMLSDVSDVISGTFAKVCGLDFLKEFTGDPVLYVLGKTDRLGTDEHNIELSNARAKAVADALRARRNEITSELWAGPGGIKIMYLGVGESMTKTEDSAASPDDRRVELYLSTNGPPVEGDWVEAIRPGAPRVDPSNVLEYYCGESDKDCAAAVAQCESALTTMCREAYPYETAGQRQCASMVSSAMAAGQVSDPQVNRWLDKGFFRFPIVYLSNGTMKVEKFDTLKKCLSRAPAIAGRADVPAGFAESQTPGYVTDLAAVRGHAAGSTIYCTAEKGWMSPHDVWLSETPRGEFLWFKDAVLGLIGRDRLFASKISVAARNNTIILPTHEVRPDNLGSVAQGLVSDLVEMLVDGPFVHVCLGGDGVPKAKIVFKFGEDVAKDEATVLKMSKALAEALGREIVLHPLTDRLRRRVRFEVVAISGNNDRMYAAVEPIVDRPIGDLNTQGTYGESSGRSEERSLGIVPTR